MKHVPDSCYCEAVLLVFSPQRVATEASQAATAREKAQLDIYAFCFLSSFKQV